ncbi:MAG: phosphopentomutase [Actinobacteria bacterium]|nr:phosphopentomutase [Actinomycetota bacterium]
MTGGAAERRALILVIDGFGVGAMPDAGDLRSGDVTADTLGSLERWSREHRGRGLEIPHLAAIGLAALRPDLGLSARPFAGQSSSTARRSALGYPGADTFAGHQTMMGADMSRVVMCRVGERIPELTRVLVAAGHRVDLLDGDKPLLVVDGAALVHDNLEADPGLNWNVSARLDEMPWEQILEISTIVREHSPVARVIAVGGHSDRPLADSVRPGADGTIGLDTPASGFYQHDELSVQHLGVAIDHERQLPQLADSAGVPVTLVGKAADILVARGADYRPGVETAHVLADTLAGVRRGGLTVANVQQTDLAGHQQDPARYADLLEEVDAAVPTLLAELGEAGLLVVTGDHGNDPTIGHSFHTREFTPVLAVHGSAPGSGTVRPGAPQLAPDLASLADIGASVACWLGLDPGLLDIGSPADLEPAR